VWLNLDYFVLASVYVFERIEFFPRICFCLCKDAYTFV
jgi:hypothetical protein